MIEFVFDGVDKIVGKGENATSQHFLPFPSLFSNALFFTAEKTWDCVVKGYANFYTVCIIVFQLFNL